MRMQIGRFIQVSKDNWSLLINLWSNVERKEIWEDRDVEVSLGIDFKKRHKSRGPYDVQKEKEAYENAQESKQQDSIAAFADHFVTESTKEQEEEEPQVQQFVPEEQDNQTEVVAKQDNSDQVENSPQTTENLNNYEKSESETD